MKLMKLALLGGAALAVTAAGAQADDLSTLKAEIEALNARVAQLEATPSVPNGYSLMTYSTGEATVVPGNQPSYLGKNSVVKGFSDRAHVIGVLPTADAPPSTTIEWSGYVYAIVAYADYSYQDYYNGYFDHGDTNVSIISQAQLKVVGKTDTAVGEVGVRIQLRSRRQGVSATGDNSHGPRGLFYANEYWGWWAMTPELTFGGGYSGSLGNIGYGMDGACNCWWTDWFSSSSSSYRTGNFDGSYDPGNAPQVRLSWKSGPIGFAVALEEGDSFSYFGQGDLAVAGEITFSGDTINGEVSAIAYESNDIDGASDDPDFDHSGWQVGGGIGFGLGDIANVSLAAAVGDEPARGGYWGVSGLVSFGLTDTVSAEAGANWKTWDDASGDDDLLEVLAGIYYNPVSQLTFGLEAEWADLPTGLNALGTDSFSGEDLVVFDFVSIWRF